MEPTETSPERSERDRTEGSAKPRFRRSTSWYRLQVAARDWFNRIPLAESQKVYILTLVIGVVCGMAAVAFHFLLGYFEQNLIYRACRIAGWLRVPAVLLMSALGGLAAGAGIYFLAPEAAGSGIPQVKKAFYLDAGRIPARVIPGRLFLSSLNIGTGASLGREGPTVQLCAALASLLGRLFAISRERLKTLLPVGAAAGLAAAFNTPIAAVTFTLEEILADVSVRPLGSIVIAAVIASVVERGILGEHPLFDVPGYRLGSAVELVFYAVLGAIAALAAVLFNRGILRLRAWLRTTRRIPVWAMPAAGGVVLGAVGLAALVWTGSPSVFGIGYAKLSEELNFGLPINVLLVLGSAKLIGTVVSYGSGSTGGIFGPSLFIGGMLGGLVGHLSLAVLGADVTQPGAFALVGMGAFFAGTVRAPVTSIIIIFEMTNNYAIILPLMVANITSYVLASRIDPVPIYDALLTQDGLHLPHKEKAALREIQVSAAMTRAVVTIPSCLTAAEAFHHVQTLPQYHHSYPLMDASDRVVGIVTFNDLKRSIAGGRGGSRLGSLNRRKLLHAHPDHTLEQVILKLGRHGISQLPVVSRRDTGKLLGIITMDDVTRALAGATDREAHSKDTPVTS